MPVVYSGATHDCIFRNKCRVQGHRWLDTKSWSQDIMEYYSTVRKSETFSFTTMWIELGGIMSNKSEEEGWIQDNLTHSWESTKTVPDYSGFSEFWKKLYSRISISWMLPNVSADETNSLPWACSESRSQTCRIHNLNSSPHIMGGIWRCRIKWDRPKREDQIPNDLTSK